MFQPYKNKLFIARCCLSPVARGFEVKESFRDSKQTRHQELRNSGARQMVTGQTKNSIWSDVIGYLCLFRKCRYNFWIKMLSLTVLNDFGLDKDKYLNAMQFFAISSGRDCDYLWLNRAFTSHGATRLPGRDIISWLRVKACAIVRVTAGLLINYTEICTAVLSLHFCLCSQ